MHIIKECLDALDAKWHIALSGFLITSIILAADQTGLRYMENVSPRELSIAFYAWAAFLVVLLVSVTRSLLTKRQSKKLKKQREAWQIAQLSELPKEELDTLAWRVSRSERVFNASFTDPTIRALVAKGYLKPVSAIVFGTSWPFEIPDHIWWAMRCQMPGSLNNSFTP